MTAVKNAGELAVTAVNLVASPPWARSNWWWARRDRSQNGGEPAMGAVTYVDILPAYLPLQHKRLASPPWARSKMQVSPPNWWDRRLENSLLI